MTCWKNRCSTSSMLTYVIGIKLPMFIWARISHIQNWFWPLSSLGTVREASFSKILGSHSRSGIFSSRKSFETEYRKVHSSYVREHRNVGGGEGGSIVMPPNFSFLRYELRRSSMAQIFRIFEPFGKSARKVQFVVQIEIFQIWVFCSSAPYWRLFNSAHTCPIMLLLPQKFELIESACQKRFLANSTSGQEIRVLP